MVCQEKKQVMSCQVIAMPLVNIQLNAQSQSAALSLSHLIATVHLFENLSLI